MDHGSWREPRKIRCILFYVQVLLGYKGWSPKSLGQQRNPACDNQITVSRCHCGKGLSLSGTRSAWGSTAPPHGPPLRFCRFHGLGETQLVIQIKSNKTGPPAISIFFKITQHVGRHWIIWWHMDHVRLSDRWKGNEYNGNLQVLNNY